MTVEHFDQLSLLAISQLEIAKWKTGRIMKFFKKLFLALHVTGLALEVSRQYNSSRPVQRVKHARPRAYPMAKPNIIKTLDLY